MTILLKQEISKRMRNTYLQHKKIIEKFKQIKTYSFICNLMVMKYST